MSDTYMKQNPCRYCALAFEYKGKHSCSYSCAECAKCENLKAHREYLQSHRKYVPGDEISDLSELLEQEWVMWSGSTRHIEVIKSMQLRTVLSFLERGAFKKAIRKESEEK